jgi:hypothetical protein
VLQLARLVVQLGQREALVADLSRHIEPLRPLKMFPVEGELSLLQSLQEMLRHSRAIIEAIPSQAETTIAEKLLELTELLEDVQWELAGDRITELAAKRQQQDTVLQQFKAEVEGYRASTNQLREALSQAERVRAPVRTYSDLLRRLVQRLGQADRTLLTFEQPFTLLIEAVNDLKQETGDLPSRLQTIDEITRQTERYVRNAELMLIQSPLDLYGRYQYEIALRTAGETGAHGTNLQSTGKIVQQDRELMQHAIKQITAAVQQGQARQDAAPTPGDAPPVAPPPEAEATRSAIRRYVFGDEQLVTEAPVNLTGLVREMGDLMYRLFIPDQVQEYLRATTTSITIDTNDLELPWEFLYYDQQAEVEDGARPTQPQRDSQNFLCLNRPVARRLRGKPLPTRFAPRLDPTTKRQFLILANPTGDLPGAEQEVDILTAALEKDWKDLVEIEVLRTKEVTGRRLNQLLRSERYDVIHYSGHAFFDDTDPDYSGLLLHNREVFFAEKVRRLLGGRPLVFLNSCESARAANEGRDGARAIHYNLQKPAQGLAASFVYGGALGCIGSLWPINDVRAARFAVEFYNQVLEGQLIGEAMRRARVKIKSDEPNEITWAAFVLYGDPTYRLVE